MTALAETHSRILKHLEALPVPPNLRDYDRACAHAPGDVPYAEGGHEDERRGSDVGPTVGARPGRREHAIVGRRCGTVRSPRIAPGVPRGA